MITTMTATARTRRPKRDRSSDTERQTYRDRHKSKSNGAATAKYTRTATRHTGDQSQRNHAYQSLRWALILRRLPEGQRLREAEWSRHLGVNRTALREALARLHSQGLVVEGAKTGYFVPRYTREEIAETLDVRAMVEGLAVERIIRLRKNLREKLKPLHESCEELEWILSKGFVSQIAEADYQFHDRLVALCGNHRLMTLHHCLSQAELAITGFDREVAITVGRAILADHRRLVDAIENARPDDARTILQDHLKMGPTECS
jgi:DNA-binding GntR family transcriptional regulator